jgi:superfamily II DNA or RNA helicase
MATDPHLATIEQALDSLKDFQRETVETVYSRLFGRKQKSMLVADEVGLGKTIVAKGVIARALRDRRLRGDTTPFKVTYICSNQVIAGENIGKLNVFPDRDLTAEIARRVAYLAYEPKAKSAAQSYPCS